MSEPTESPAQTEPVATDVATAETSSADVAESTPESSPWNRLFGFLKGEKKAETSEASVEDAKPSEPVPSTITLTQDELDRKIQAETDRRETKRKKDDLERQERERREKAERQLDPNSPEYSPYDGSEEKARIEAEQKSAKEFTDFLGQIGKEHDIYTLDVVTSALPEKERERILKLPGAGQALEGRALIVRESLKALEKHWRAQGARDAEENLKEDPLFRKRVFTEHRDQVEEPELVIGTPANGKVDFMQQLQSEYRQKRGRRS